MKMPCQMKLFNLRHVAGLLAVALAASSGCGGGNETGQVVAVSPEFQKSSDDINKNMGKDISAKRKAFAAQQKKR